MAARLCGLHRGMRAGRVASQMRDVAHCLIPCTASSSSAAHPSLSNGAGAYAPRLVVHSRQLPGTRQPYLLLLCAKREISSGHSHGGNSHNGSAGGHSHGGMLKPSDFDMLSVRERDKAAKDAKAVTMLGVWGNLGLTLAKAVGGWMGNSQALLADAAHSLSDLMSDGVTLFAVHFSSKPPDETHPYGYGRYEAMGTYTVAALLVFAGMGLGWEASEKLIHLLAAPDNAAVDEGVLHPGVIWIAVASIVVKEGLYWRTVKVGKRLKSQLLIANAWHHRSDALSSVVALVGIAGVVAGYPLLDPLAAVLVSGMVIQAGVNIGRDAVQDLADKADADTLNEVHQVIEEIRDKHGDGAILAAGRVRSRKAGPSLILDIDIQVDPTMTVSAAHQITDLIRIGVKNRIDDVIECKVHVCVNNPHEHPDPTPNAEGLQPQRPQSAVMADVTDELAKVPQVLEMTHFICHYLDNKIEVHIDVILDSSLTADQMRHTVSLAKARVESVPDIDFADIHVELKPHHDVNPLSGL